MPRTPSTPRSAPTAPHSPPRPASALGRWSVWLRRCSARPWFLPAGGFVAAADFFLPILPTQSLLIASTLLHPARWLRVGFWFLVGGVLGGAILAAVVDTWGQVIAGWLLGDAMQGAGWRRTQELVQRHGAWALFALALAPWPVRTGVAVCAFAGVPWPQIVLALLAGRAVAFPGLAFLVSRSPPWLARLRFFARLRAEVLLIEAARGAAKSLPVVALVVALLAAVPLPAATLAVAQFAHTPGEVLREYRTIAGEVVVSETVWFGSDLAAGARSLRFADSAAQVVFTVSTTGSVRTLRLDRAWSATTTRTEPADEPLLTSAALAPRGSRRRGPRSPAAPASRRACPCSKRARRCACGPPSAHQRPVEPR